MDLQKGGTKCLGRVFSADSGADGSMVETEGRVSLAFTTRDIWLSDRGKVGVFGGHKLGSLANRTSGLGRFSPQWQQEGGQRVTFGAKKSLSILRTMKRRTAFGAKKMR